VRDLKSLGEGHPLILLAAHEVGAAHTARGDRSRALPFARAAAVGRARTLGAAHRDSLLSALALAGAENDVAAAAHARAALRALGMSVDVDDGALAPLDESGVGAGVLADTQAAAEIEAAKIEASEIEASGVGGGCSARKRARAVSKNLLSS
jgi:hypothetical protein